MHDNDVAQEGSVLATYTHTHTHTHTHIHAHTHTHTRTHAHTHCMNKPLAARLSYLRSTVGSCVVIDQPPHQNFHTQDGRLQNHDTIRHNKCMHCSLLRS